MITPIQYINADDVISEIPFNKMIDQINALAGSVWNQQNVIPQIMGTYDQLRALVDAGELSAGTSYLLTDYQTKYVMPYTAVVREVETPERLILLAAGSDRFYPVCASLDYPEDVVYYDFFDDRCEDAVTPRKGFIMRRIDTKYSNDLPHDWRTMTFARWKADAATWTSGAVTRNTVYKNGSNLYLATFSGTPSAISDTTYFSLLCTVNDYYFSKASQYLGLTYSIDYAERYVFNAGVTHTVTSPTPNSTLSLTLFPENNHLAGGSLKNQANVSGLTDVVFMYNSTGNRPQNNTVGPDSYGGTFVNALGNTVGCKNYGFVILTNYNIVGNYNYGIRIASGSYNEVGNYNFGMSIYGGSNKIGNSNYRTNIYGSGNTVESNCYDSSFTGGYSHIMSCNYSAITAANFNYNIVHPYALYNKNVTAYAELYGKAYSHEIYRATSGTAYAVHYVTTTPTYTTLV